MSKGTTQETDYPYRFGTSVVLKTPFGRKAVVVGWWRHTVEENEALMRAIGGKELHWQDTLQNRINADNKSWRVSDAEVDKRWDELLQEAEEEARRDHEDVPWSNTQEEN